MKIPIWTKSEYVTYIGIPPSYVWRVKPLRNWRAGRLSCILLSHIIIIYCEHLFVNHFHFLFITRTSASIGRLNDVTIMIPAASAIASPMAFCALRTNSDASWRSAASIA